MKPERNAAHSYPIGLKSLRLYLPHPSFDHRDKPKHETAVPSSPRRRTVLHYQKGCLTVHQTYDVSSETTHTQAPTRRYYELQCSSGRYHVPVERRIHQHYCCIKHHRRRWWRGQPPSRCHAIHAVVTKVPGVRSHCTITATNANDTSGTVGTITSRCDDGRKFNVGWAWKKGQEGMRCRFWNANVLKEEICWHHQTVQTNVVDCTQFSL